jgi:hypothetical protein
MDYKQPILRILRRYWSCLFALIALLAPLYLISGVADAVSQDITITPTSVSPVINPGSAYRGSFQVIDQGKSGYKFLVYATPYNVQGEDYSPDFTALPTAPNITGWINFSSPGGYIKPGQSITLNYTISIPENTQPGGYYAAAFAETQYPQIPNHITLNERVGELFYIQAAGPVAKKGELLTWQSSLFQKPPLTSTIRLQNNGSINYPANIQVSVKDILGHTKYSLTTQKELLPQTIRRVTIPWNKTPSIGLFKVSGSVSFLNQQMTLGTKWVLIMSTTIRVIILIVVLILVVFVEIKKLYGAKKGPKRYHRH